MEPINRRTKRAEPVGLMAVRARGDEREQLPIELAGDFAGEGSQRRVCVMEVVPGVQAQLPHPNDHRAQRGDLRSLDRFHSLLEEIDRVAKPIPGLGTHDGGDRHLFAPFLQRQEATGEVSAVDRRYVARKEWLQLLGVVPVEDMPLVVSHARQAVKHPSHAERQLARPQISEVICG